MIDQLSLLERVSFWAESAQNWAGMAGTFAEGGILGSSGNASERFKVRLARVRGALAEAEAALRRLESWTPAVPLPGDEGWDL